MEAAMKATGEVAWPVIGATATTLAAFFPMLFWPGIMGEFMHFLPVTLMVTLSASLFVALIINPALCSYFMGIPKSVRPDRPSSSEIKSLGEKPTQRKELFFIFGKLRIEFFYAFWADTMAELCTRMITDICLHLMPVPYIVSYVFT